MLNWVHREWPGLRWVLLPLGLLALLGAWFFAACIDGWCPGVEVGMALTWAGLCAFITLTYAWLRSRGLRQSRAGLAAWLAAGALGAGVVMLAQFNEGDWVTGAAALLVAAVAASAGWVLSRNPHS